MMMVATMRLIRIKVPKMSIATNNSVPQNIIYKHKKTVHWITDSFSQPSKTSVYFYTTKKAAMKHLNRLGAKKTSKIIISAPSANSSFFDDNLFEKFSLQCPPQTPQWFISINDSWRCFGWEMSAALEVAFQKGLPGVNFDKFLKVGNKIYLHNFYARFVCDRLISHR